MLGFRAGRRAVFTEESTEIGKKIGPILNSPGVPYLSSSALSTGHRLNRGWGQLAWLPHPALGKSDRAQAGAWKAGDLQGGLSIATLAGPDLP